MTRSIWRWFLVALVFVLMPGRVSATFHLVKVVEVFAGATAEPMAQYVMLQMYFPGQTLVSGHKLGVFDANGTSARHLYLLTRPVERRQPGDYVDRHADCRGLLWHQCRSDDDGGYPGERWARCAGT